MSQKESKRSRDIMKHLRLKGCFCFKVWGSEHMMAGLPDIIGCYQGRFFGLEVKEPGGKASTIQLHVQAQIRKAGGISDTIITRFDAYKLLGIDDDE